VRERQLGDLFEYQIEHPVTIRRNQSALVPIVLRPFEGRPVLLYNRAARAENPMRSVEFKNSTGLTLEGGPVTVLEGGSYVGEAMLDTAKPDETRLVPYAVELAVRVLDNVETHSENVSKVVIHKGTLKAQYHQVQVTTYSFNNKAAAEQTAYLDHPRPGGEWKLFDTEPPHETTESHWRFRFALPGNRVTKFVVRQRRRLAQTHALGQVTDRELSLWLEQKYLDGATAGVLRQVIAQRRQLAGVEEKVRQLEQERADIHAEQQRIRENLQALGERPSEKGLRERFVRTLNGQEDRLEQITAEVKAHAAERDRCKEEIDALLADLEYEALV
jgi:hypothetical protein